MTALIHILGSDIPHHNQTVLRFFNDELASGDPDAREFMVAGQDKGLSEAFPALTIRFWPDKAALAKAVVAKAKADRKQRFFFHGQFNTGLWLALFSGGLNPPSAAGISGEPIFMKSPAAGNSVFSIRCAAWRRGAWAAFCHPWRSQLFC
jgi:hypothetical protein